MKKALTWLLLTATVWADPQLTPVEQDRYRFPARTATHGMVVGAVQLAADQGVEVLKQGGNAVDAAVTTAFCMAVTLPRAGNIGGGGFMLVRNPQGQVYALDFREMAPGKASRDMFLDPKGDRDADKATIGGLSVGVPGTVAGMTAALERFGTIPLKQAVEPARKLASEGFRVPQWMHEELIRVTPLLGRFPESRAIFLPDGQPLATNTILKQPDLARVLETIQEKGRAGFYSGWVAEKIAAGVQKHGGLMATADLAGYKAIWREPVKGTYRGVTVWSMPPPSSGGVHVVQALNVLENWSLADSGHNSALTIHRLTETLRQVYADRSKWLGDPDFVKVPVAWLTSKEYAKQIFASIGERARVSKELQPGKPTPYESPQTTHFCVVDEKGWAVSLTYTLNFSYGSGLVAEGTGILMNNEMDDFSAAPGKPNGFGLVGGEANSIQPGKRPLSSMTPTILEKDGKLVAAIGSPGGSRIITVVLQVILNLMDFDLNAQTAVSEPRIHEQWLPDQLELEQGFSPDTEQLLRGMGHKIVRADSIGHAMIIVARPDGRLEGGTDPRRAGGLAGY